MLNLKALREKERQKQEAAKRTARPSAALARVAKDVSEMDLPSTCHTVFPDSNDLTNFKVIVCPDEGLYRGGRFMFDFRVGANYPHEPPSVKCETSVFHPNIDTEGNVCLNILRDEWNPVLTLGSVVLGLLVIFLEPNTREPLNKHAAQMLLHDRRQFAEFIQGCLFSARYQARNSSIRTFP